MATTPPSSRDSSMPMAVVTDLGSRVTYSWWSSPKSTDRARMPSPPAMMPAPRPQRMASQWVFSSFSCRYRGTARATVAGVSR